MGCYTFTRYAVTCKQFLLMSRRKGERRWNDKMCTVICIEMQLTSWVERTQLCSFKTSKMKMKGRQIERKRQVWKKVWKNTWRQANREVETKYWKKQQKMRKSKRKYEWNNERMKERNTHWQKERKLERCTDTKKETKRRQSQSRSI